MENKFTGVIKTKETKEIIINDIISLVEYCRVSRKLKECNKVFNEFNCILYSANVAIIRNLKYKNKHILDKLRENILEKIVY